MQVTFTNKAATEMKERVQEAVGGELASQVIMGTFHSIASRFLRRHGAKVLSVPVY
jgi:DNA helicase-2/ATP-dependent DNA helicase PcrA